MKKKNHIVFQTRSTVVFFLFLADHTAMKYDQLLTWYCCVLRCALWLNNTFYGEVSEKVNRKCSARNTTSQLSTPYTDPVPSNSSPPKCQTFSYLLPVYVTFLIMWPLCLCCCERGRGLSSRWWLRIIRSMMYQLFQQQLGFLLLSVEHRAK